MKLRQITSLDELRGLEVGTELVYDYKLSSKGELVIGDFEEVSDDPLEKGWLWLVLQTHYSLKGREKRFYSEEEIIGLYNQVKQPQNQSLEESAGFHLQTFPETDLVRVYLVERV